MRGLISVLLALSVWGCAAPESNFDGAAAIMHKAEERNPDKDFGMIEESPNKTEFMAMATQGWSVYMSVPIYKDRSGGGHI